MDNTRKNNDVVDQLNSLLRGEISAVETYRIARERVGALGPQGELETCQRSHEQRVMTLTNRIVELGGEPAQGSGAWGAFAKLVEGGASVLGEAAAVAALEEGEDHGIRDYRDAMKINERSGGVDVSTLVADCYAEQQRTHRIMSDLKKMMKHAGEARPTI